MAPIPVRFSDLEFFNFAFWSISVAHASEMPCVLSTICLHMNLRAQEASNFNLFRRAMTSRRHTQQSTVNVVVVSRKRCQIASLLLHNINGKRYMTYRIESISMTLSHFQGHSYCKSFKYMIFRTAVLWQDFNLHSASRGPSAVAELLVYTGRESRWIISYKLPLMGVVRVTWSIFTARCYASVVYAVVVSCVRLTVRPSVRHTPVFTKTA